MGVIENQQIDIVLLCFHTYRKFPTVLLKTTVLETIVPVGFLLPVSYADLLDILMLRREPEMEKMLFEFAQIYI